MIEWILLVVLIIVRRVGCDVLEIRCAIRRVAATNRPGQRSAVTALALLAVLGRLVAAAVVSAVTEVAVAAGAAGLVALDLYTEMVRPRGNGRRARMPPR